MVTIGNTDLPGVETTVKSSQAVGVSFDSIGEVCIIGEADLEEGTGEPDTMYRITTSNKAATWFGPDSVLAGLCTDALREGAFPVYAVAPKAVEETESLVNGPSVGEFNFAPVAEKESKFYFSPIGPDENVEIVYRDVEGFEPEANEVFINPVSGKYNVGDNASDIDELSYEHYDYESAIDASVDERGESIDFFASWTEHRDVVDYVEAAVNELESHYNFSIALAGAEAYIDDTTTYESPYDNSRVQLIYPSRNRDGESIIGSYAGLRSALGLSESPMRKRINSQRRMYHRLSTDDYKHMIEANVNPIASSSTGSRIIDDVTTVQDDNLDEKGMQQGISRLIVDFITTIVHTSADSFIGELHNISARNTLKSVIKSKLKNLVEENVVLGYVVSIERVDAMTAEVHVGVETVKPLRNIVAEVTAGEVN